MTVSGDTHYPLFYPLQSLVTPVTSPRSVVSAEPL